MKNECCQSTIQLNQLTIEDVGRVVKCHECGSTYIMQGYLSHDWLTYKTSKWMELVPNVTFRVREKPSADVLETREIISNGEFWITTITVCGVLFLLMITVMVFSTDVPICALYSATLALLLVLAKPWA